MARMTPTVRDDFLLWRDGDEERSLAVGSPEWFAWLDQATSFSFAGLQGTFTASKERFQRGGWYWRAHRSHRGVLYHAYMGKSEALTLRRLNEIAAALSAKIGASEGVRSDAAAGGRRHPSVEIPDWTAVLASSRSPTRHQGKGQREPLLATKLLLPPVRADLVRRPRLIARLNEISWRKLILISAPAGSGKTTLLSQWCEQSAMPIASFSLDTDDDDPVRFWTYFIAALQGLFPNIGQSALSVIRSRQGLPIEPSLRVLLNAMAVVSDDFVLVLDDYHSVKSPAIHGAMDYLLDHLPPRAHLVIATRADPPLALARLRGKGQMAELRVSDLSFTAEEAASFFNQVMRLSLTVEDVAALGERTEGWAVGLQIAALSLQAREDVRGFIEAFTGEHRHIIDYLVEEVLGSLPEAVQAFLLQTSILDRLNAGLCEAVTEQPNGREMLETLEHANLFTVPLDEAGHWYRYHHVFSDFLRARLQQVCAERVPELHRRASIWYAKHDLPHEAVNHALSARDLELIANLVEISGWSLLVRGEMATIRSWLRSLPDEVIAARPRLCLLQAWALAALGEPDAAEARLEAVNLWVPVGAGPSGSIEDPAEAAERQFLEDQLAVLRALIANARGDWRLVIHYGRRILRRQGELEGGLRGAFLQYLGEAYWRTGEIVRAEETLTEACLTSETLGHIPNTAISLFQLGAVQIVRGRLRDAASSCQRALRLVTDRESKGCWYAGWPHLGWARLQYEWNDLPAAESHAKESIELAREGGSPALLLAGYGTLARIRQAQGDISTALEIVDEAQQLANRTDNRREFSRLKAYQARLWLKQGNVQGALRWARESGLRSGDEPTYERESEHLALAQVLLAQGEAEAALRLLEGLQMAEEAAGRMGSVIKTLVLQSAARHALGAGDKALAPLERALSLAEPEGYVRTFLDRGAAVAATLARIIERGLHDAITAERPASAAYVRRLLSAFASSGRGTPSPSFPSWPCERLSDRELEVLRLFGAGWSTPDIARELVLTLNTVKTHLRNIYRKLDVHSGREAVAKARHSGLL